MAVMAKAKMMPEEQPSEDMADLPMSPPLPPSRGHYQHDTATITGSGYQTSLLRRPASPEEALFYCPYFFAAPASVGKPWVHLIGCDLPQGKLGKWMSALLRFYTLGGVCLTPGLLVGESLEQEDLVLGRKKITLVIGGEPDLSKLNTL